MLEKLFPNNSDAQEKVIKLMHQSMPAVQKRRKLAQILVSEDEDFESDDSSTSSENLSEDLRSLNISKDKVLICSIHAFLISFIQIIFQSNTSVKSEASLDLPRVFINIEDCLSNEEIKRRFTNPEFWLSPGQIEKYLPNDPTTQQNLKNILERPMPANIKSKKLEKLFDERTETLQEMTDIEYGKALYERFVKRSTKLCLYDSDFSD